MHTHLKIKDGFLGEKQVNLPREIIVNKLRKQEFLNNLFITSIGYFPKAKFHFRERQLGCHDDILIYCVAGKGYYETADARYTLQANQFMILPRGEYHCYHADIRDPWSIYWVHFSGTQLKSLNSWIQVNTLQPPTSIDFDKKIVQQWFEMYAVLESGYTEENIAYANLCLYGFLANFLFPRTHILLTEKENPIGDSIAYMKLNINQIVTVDLLAARLNYSSSHYSTLFKSKTGMAPIDYFIKLKIQHACQLLRQTDLKINQIAGKLGYEDLFYFSRLFKKATGCSPKAYRQRIVIL